MLHLRTFVACAFCLVSCVAVAQQSDSAVVDASSDGNDSYFALRRSKDRARKLTADRYLNLVKLQEWTDKTGKFRTIAKYVEHDPDLTWVKLEAARGRGADRVVKQIQVPVDKLSKQCQSRVRQIARLRPKMDELVIAEAAAQKEEEQGETGARGEFSEERLADVGPERMSEYGVEGGVEEGANAIIDPRMTGREALPGGEQPTALNIDPTQWRTSYESFRQNLSVMPGPDGMARLDWGELVELRALSEALTSLSAAAPEARERSGGPQRVADAAAAIGEVTWEAPFLGLSRGLLGVKPMFALAPAAPPASVQFLLADPQHTQQWAKLQPGQSVRFHGQLKMTTPHSMIVWVRMSDESVAEIDAQMAAAPPAEPSGFVPTRENPR